ncbi:hypothetical protein [Reinekea sp. G2M2-21]|uniref:hypothetical protein n=1 Tax=Reinekea sp. G2M2-21 TaxID=2788942 RepID=UPI0018AB9CCA|nr:hypothetical protein [Reinekea sp. G2M2-21]
MTTYKSEPPIRRPRTRLGWLLTDRSFILLMGLFAAYYVTESLLIGLTIILLNVWQLFASRLSPSNVSSCEVTLHEDCFTYRELKSKYCVDINYNRVRYVKMHERFGLTTVQIGIDEQAELSCVNIENSGALVNALKSAAGI